jgi:hypothetical protein
MTILAFRLLWFASLTGQGLVTYSCRYEEGRQNDYGIASDDK